MGVGESTCQVGHPFIGLQHLTYLVGHFAQLLHYPEVFVAVHRALRLGQSQRKHCEHRHLAREGLGRCHTDFGANVDIGTRVGGTRNTGTDGVADTIDEGSLLLGQQHGSQRIGSLATLADGYHHITLRHNRIAVSELTGVLYIDRNAAQRLNHLLADESGVPRSAASHNDNALGTKQLTAVIN